MQKKRVLLRGNQKTAVFWLVVMLLLFCTYRLYLYRTESTETMTGQSEHIPQSLYGTLAQYMER